MCGERGDPEATDEGVGGPLPGDPKPDLPSIASENHTGIKEGCAEEGEDNLSDDVRSARSALSLVRVFSASRAYITP